MSKTIFLSKDNTTMLWEVLSDEDIFKSQPYEIKNIILKIFSENISTFYNSEIKNQKTTLIEMNKKYILMILNFIKNNYSNTKINKLTIYNESAPLIETNNIELITNEEIKKDKITKFEDDLNTKEKEFKSMFTKTIPDSPNFSDNNNDKPITEMEKAIKEMVEQRNYDMEQINKSHNTTNSENFLKTIETTNKPPIQIEKKEQTPNYNKLKHIKIENNLNESNVIENNIIHNKKHVTWETNENITLSFEDKNTYYDNDYDNDNDNETKDIFSKLKPIQNINNENETKINLRITTLENTVENIKEQVELLNNNITKILEKFT
jgi:hypothetical protein